GRERQPDLRRGVHHRLLHGGSGRRDHRPQPIGGAGDGRGRAGAVVHRGGGGRPGEPGRRVGRRGDRRPLARDRHQHLPRAGAGGVVHDRRDRPPGPSGRALREGDMSAIAVPAPAARRSPLRIAAVAGPIAVILAVLPLVMDSYRTIQLAYGLIFAIAALGFNILLGYTGLLSFGHAAYFGAGAYTVAFMVKYLHVQSMELFLLGTVVAAVVLTSLFGYVCVRYTRIFFSILTLSLAQVLWSLGFKFFWVTGGTDGLRVPTPKLLGVVTGESEDKIHFLSHGYYY